MWTLSSTSGAVVSETPPKRGVVWSSGLTSRHQRPSNSSSAGPSSHCVVSAQCSDPVTMVPRRAVDVVPGEIPARIPASPPWCGMVDQVFGSHTVTQLDFGLFLRSILSCGGSRYPDVYRPHCMMIECRQFPPVDNIAIPVYGPRVRLDAHESPRLTKLTKSTESVTRKQMMRLYYRRTVDEDGTRVYLRR